jgi:23S rRNA (guanosine2251-2'-O)-methyltransferase
LIVYGRHPVEELLQAAPAQVERIVVDRGGRTDGLTLPEGLRIDVDAGELDRLTNGGNHQGIAAVLGPFRYTPLGELLAAVEDQTTACVVVLDQVQDPHNLGAILRSAAAFGADGVVIAKDRSASVTDTVVRTSAGLAYRVPIARVTNIARTLREMKEDHRFWAVATVLGGDTDIWDIDFKMKTALVMGGEGPGIRRLVEETCDFQARIPMQVGVDSLNVSVATGVVLYEIARQVRPGTPS